MTPRIIDPDVLNFLDLKENWVSTLNVHRLVFKGVFSFLFKPNIPRISQDPNEIDCF